jgi:hypothetical protein
MISVSKTAGVPAAYIRVRHVVATLSDTFAHSLDAPFGVVKAYVQEPGEGQWLERCTDRRVRPSSCESRFDGKAFRVSNVRRGPVEHLSSRRESCLLRRCRFHSPGNCIRFQQIASTLELDPPDQTALAGTVRPGKNR